MVFAERYGRWLLALLILAAAPLGRDIARAQVNDAGDLSI